jgi:pimeloyl-ACP methyl ester carboxylesterase
MNALRVRIDNDELAATLTEASSGGGEKLVILVHGGPGGFKDGPHNLYADLARMLADRGIASIRFDFRGAGQSTGRYRDMTISRQARELAIVKEFVRSTIKPKSIGMVGESYGATIALRDLDHSCRALVLLWPAIWLLDNAFSVYVTPENLKEAEEHGYITDEGVELGLSFLREVGEVRDVSSALAGSQIPTLFIHGTADLAVPHVQSERGMSLVAGKRRIVLVPGGDHGLTRGGEREVVYKEAVGWLESFL